MSTSAEKKGWTSEEVESLRNGNPELYRRLALTHLEFFAGLPQNEGVPPGVVKAKFAFLQALQGLLSNAKHDRWCAAYTGTGQVGIARTEVELVAQCKKQGLQDYYIGIITPYDLDDEIESANAFRS